MATAVITTLVALPLLLLVVDLLRPPGREPEGTADASGDVRPAAAPSSPATVPVPHPLPLVATLPAVPAGASVATVRAPIAAAHAHGVPVTGAGRDAFADGLLAGAVARRADTA